MLVKFYENSLKTTLIKNLVTSTPLPIYDVVVDGDYVVKKSFYIYKSRVIYIVTSGIIYVPKTTLELGLSYVSQLEGGASFLVESIFDFGKYYIDSTRKYPSPNSFYDATTHKLLYKYLSCVKAFHKIDLFNLYNIYAGEVIDTFHLNPSAEAGKEEQIYPIIMSENTRYRVIAIPIKFNHEYTIWMNSTSNTIMCPVLWNRSGLAQIKKNDKKEAKSKFSLLNKICEVDQLRFADPYLYTGVNLTPELVNETQLYNFQNSLYLIVQTLASNKCTIMVMEGDHRISHHNIIAKVEKDPATGQTRVIGTDIQGLNKSKDVRLVVNADNTNEKISKYLDSLTINQQNSLYRPRKQLCAMNSNTNFAFNDKLIEYILHNAITNREWIESNITMIQNIIPNDIFEEDIWQDSMRLDVYNKQLSQINKDKYYTYEYDEQGHIIPGKETNDVVYSVIGFDRPFDCNGFVDREAEHFLYKNKERIMK